MEPRDKSLYAGVKGRRSLQYENTSLLKGKRIYLDLHGYKRASFIESGLKERGAAIEGFFTKETRYLVTCRNLSEQDKCSSSPRTPSSSVLSNVNTNKKSSHPAQSPFSTNSPDTPKATPITVGRVSREQHFQQLSRSRNIVAAAKMKSTGSSDVLQLAKNWNIKIIHVEDIVKYFSKHPVGAEVPIKPDYHKTSSPGTGVRKLKAPFLKCEDVSRMYKPLICEVKKWPRLNLDCGPDEGPFDTPHKHQKESDVKSKTEKSDKKKPGYCECCGVRFDDFTLHVKGDQHMAYATNPDNFASLDAMYDLYKIPTLDEFVAAHTNSNPDQITLPEEGSSPVKYSLLCYDDDTEITTSVVDIETVSEGQQVVCQSLTSSSDEAPPERRFPSGLGLPRKNSSPEPTINNGSNNCNDLSPTAKRCRRSWTSCTPPGNNSLKTDYMTPPRPSPLKGFSIVLSDSLKSPIRSPAFSGKSSPMRSPTSGNRIGDFLQDSQSPKHCVVLLHDITKLPMNIVASPNTPRNSTNRRIVRSASVSPEQRRVGRDTLMGSPVKEDTVCSSSNVHKIIPKHLYQSRDILLASSQSTPQKEYR